MSTDTTHYPPPTDAERAFYDENGYIVLKNALNPIGLDRVRRAFERREAETRAEWEEELRRGKFPKRLWQWAARAYHSSGF